MPDALIFDIDGTLLDSVDLHADAWQNAFSHFGYNVQLQTIRSQIGKGGDQLLPFFLPPEELKRLGKDLEAYRSNLFKTHYLPLVKAFPGVRQLFEKVVANGQKIALASSARGDELEHYKKIADIEDLVHVSVSSADAKRSKPFPDIFKAALEQLGKGISSGQVVAIGDSPYDAEGAKRANLRAVGVLCGGFPEEKLRDAGCIAIYRDPGDLLRRYETSLLAPGDHAYRVAPR
jgi:beta-phosphoglucomutase-like phosphatase (HAD superfamily)